MQARSGRQLLKVRVRVSTLVAAQVVVIAPEETQSGCRHEKEAAGSQRVADLKQCVRILGNVFEHVEQKDDVPSTLPLEP